MLLIKSRPFRFQGWSSIWLESENFSSLTFWILRTPWKKANAIETLQFFRSDGRSSENPVFQSSEDHIRTALIRRWSLWNRGVHRWSFRFWTALTHKSSVLISSETMLMSADVFHVLWISAGKRSTSEEALFSSGYLWDLSLFENVGKILNDQIVANIAQNANKIVRFLENLGR